MILIYIPAALLLLACAALTALFLYVNDTDVQLSGRTPGFLPPKSVLAVFAHPDDEIMAAGTLTKWKRAGAQIHLLYYTRGEDGPTGGLVEKQGLGDLREQELAEVARILRADSLSVLRYPDRYLNTVPQDTLERELAKKIAQCRPDTVICFDNTIGLYGHTDHAYAGLCAQALLQRKSLGVRQMLVMTLCPSMIALARRVSKTFRERYRPENGLPAANLAIGIRRAGGVKKRVCLEHKTQRAVVGDVQPLVTKIPSFFYYRVFSREYYHFSVLKNEPNTEHNSRGDLL